MERKYSVYMFEFGESAFLT